MGLSNHTFKLDKLTIESFKTVDRSPSQRLTNGVLLGNKMEVMYNPATLTSSYANTFGASPGGVGGVASSWLRGHAKELSIDLVFDGTKVGSLEIERLLLGVRSVADHVRAFLELCHHVEGTTHEPAYLRITWGNGIFGKSGFECRLLKADIKYTAFDRDASPLRATISATFVEAVDPKAKHRELQLSSPDLTHRRVVRSGDTLPLLCREIYGSAEHYIRVAEVNGLDDFRALAPGTELFFPPFERRGGS